MMLSRKAVAGQVGIASTKMAAPVVARASSATVMLPVVAPVRTFAPVAAFSQARRSVAPCKAAAVEAAAPSATKQEKTAHPLNLVFVATEVAPWSKTGERRGLIWAFCGRRKATQS